MRAKITLGLVPPPPPKVKLSNMERVYGSRIVENPTAVEAEVRKAMQDRLMKHLMDNESRKKTATERREKKMKAAMDDRKAELHAAVFKIDGLLRNTKAIWKLQQNAKDMHCTGVLVTIKPAASAAAAGAAGGQSARAFLNQTAHRALHRRCGSAASCACRFGGGSVQRGCD